MNTPDWHVLTDPDPHLVRQNANLPGELVFSLARLGLHTGFMVHMRELLGLPQDEFIPTETFSPEYLQLTRSEAFKGANQLVQAFAGQQRTGLEGVGTAPDLTPVKRPENASPTVLIMNGVRDSRKPGFGRRLLNFGKG